jgi:hypothetical protein
VLIINGSDVSICAFSAEFAIEICKTLSWLVKVYLGVPMQSEIYGAVESARQRVTQATNPDSAQIITKKQ